MSSAMSIIPFYIYDVVGGGPRMSGTIGAIQSLCYAMACLGFAGMVTRVAHPMRLAVLGCLGYGMVLPLTGFGKTGVWVGITSVGALVLTALYWPPMQSWLGGEPDRRIRSRRMANYTIAWNLGLAVGPLFAAPLYAVNHWYAFAIVTATSAVAAAFTWSLPEESHTIPLPASTEASPESDIQACEAQLHAVWLASFMSWGMMGALRNVYPKRVDELVKAGDVVALRPGDWLDLTGIAAATQYSWLLLALYVARAVTSLVLGQWLGWRFRFELIVASQVGAAAAFFILGISNSLAVMAICCLIVGLNGGMTFFASLYYSVADPARRNRRAGIHESLVGLGGFSASMVFGEIAERTGTATPFLYAPIAVAAALVVQAWLLRRSRWQQDQAIQGKV